MHIIPRRYDLKRQNKHNHSTTGEKSIKMIGVIGVTQYMIFKMPKHTKTICLQ